MKKECFFYVGTYTRPILFGTGEVLEGKGEGIYLVRLDMEQGTLNNLGVVAKSENPSYLCMDREEKRLYAVNELKEYAKEESGAVTAYAVNAVTGMLTLLNQKPTKGQDPCHLVLTEDEEVLVISNFMSGSVCAYRVGEEGLLEEAGFNQHNGKGANQLRQKSAHAHSAVMIKNSPYFYVPDLGTDRLEAYMVKPEGKIVPCAKSACVCEPGSGPRYGEYREESRRLYIIYELASRVSWFDVNQKEGEISLELKQTVSTVLDLYGEDGGDNLCADLHLTPNGRFLYASNRGHDTIAVFSVNPDSGELERVDQVSCGGRTPRNFVIEPEGRYLLVGNQDSDQIVVFHINQEDGTLTEASTLPIPVPVCILPVNQNFQP